MDIWEDLKHIYLQSLAVRDDLPEETREYVESEVNHVTAKIELVEDCGL